MRRTRNASTTKVWHNPEITNHRQASPGSGPKPTREQAAEDKRTQNQHRAALEALFTPKKDDAAEASATSGRVPAAKPSQRIVLPPAPSSDPKVVERQKLLHKLMIAEGRPNVSKAANDFLKAGFTFPEEQDVHLKLLEHNDEACVRDACEALGRLLAGEAPQRRALIESRLKRIEQFAEETSTQEAAKKLFRQVTGRGERSSTPPSST